jgi:hypothetical protein
MILRWKSCAAGIPPGNDPNLARCHGIPPRMVAYAVCAEAGWSPRRRSSWAKRRFVIEPSSAQAVGTSDASMRSAVSHGNQNSPPQSAASSAAADRALTTETASRTWARSVSRGAISGHTGAVIWHFVLSSASRDNLDTFVGASPRRGTGARKEIVYVARDRGLERPSGMARDDPASTVSRDKGHRLQPSGSDLALSPRPWCCRSACASALLLAWPLRRST